MTGTLLNSNSPEDDQRSDAAKRILIGLVCAVLLTGAVVAGYAILRKRHVQETLSLSPTVASTPRGPARIQVFLDEPLLKAGMTTVGGTVENISQETLSSLQVELELGRRKDGSFQLMTVPVSPAQLEPNQEGHYLLEVRSADYNTVKLAKVLGAGKGDSQPAEINFVTAQGQKRPPERLESKTVIVPRPKPRDGEFLNSPDQPGRVR
jgi:hypothetical protein